MTLPRVACDLQALPHLWDPLLHFPVGGGVMTECSNCNIEFEGTGLCPECLAELGIGKGTAEHLDLMDESPSPGFPSDGDGPGDAESPPG